MVGKTEHMTELMHESTDARRLRFDDGTIDFVATGIVAYLDAIQLQRSLGSSCLRSDIRIIGRMCQMALPSPESASPFPA